MVLWITLIADQLQFLLFLSMEETCKWNSFLHFISINRIIYFNTISHRFGQPIKVNWAYASSQREDTSGCMLRLFLFPLILFLMMISLWQAAADILIWCFFQVILIYLLVISALRLLMLHCLHAFLFTPVVRKFVLQIFVFEFVYLAYVNMFGIW